MSTIEALSQQISNLDLAIAALSLQAKTLRKQSLRSATRLKSFRKKKLSKINSLSERIGSITSQIQSLENQLSAKLDEQVQSLENQLSTKLDEQTNVFSQRLGSVHKDIDTLRQESKLIKKLSVRLRKLESVDVRSIIQRIFANRIESKLFQLRVDMQRASQDLRKQNQEIFVLKKLLGIYMFLIIRDIVDLTENKKFLENKRQWTTFYSFLAELCPEIQSDELLFCVHQMGKVGSTTIKRKLENSGYNVLHTHKVAEEISTRNFYIFLDKQFTTGKRHSNIFKRHLFSGLAFTYQIDKARKRGDKVKVITVARDPLSRNISGFLSTLRVELYPHYHKTGEVIHQEIEQLYNMFLDMVHSAPVDWFNRNVVSRFEVSLYDEIATKFPYENPGYLFVENDLFQFLLLEVTVLEKGFFAGLENEFNISFADKELPAANVGSNKNYSGLYKAFKQFVMDSIKSPGQLREIYSPIYESDYCKYFQYSLPDFSQ